MRLRSILMIVMLMGLIATGASAQNGAIDLLTPDQSMCQATLGQGDQFIIVGRLAGATLHPNQGGPADGGLSGAEFFVEGFPSGWFSQIESNPSASVALGNPIAAQGTAPDETRRANIAFGDCQGGSDTIVVLYTITAIPLGDPVTDQFMQVVASDPPTNPLFTTPIITICDDPTFTAVAVNGGAFLINPDQATCTTAVEEVTWGEIKSLYN